MGDIREIQIIPKQKHSERNREGVYVFGEKQRRCVCFWRETEKVCMFLERNREGVYVFGYACVSIYAISSLFLKKNFLF